MTKPTAEIELTDGTVRVFKFRLKGCGVYVTDNLTDGIAMVGPDIDSMDEDDEMTITTSTMTREELAALPEFDGF